MNKGRSTNCNIMIPLMDVSRQYKRIQSELDDAALNVLQSGKYIMGNDESSNVFSFEQEFADYIGTTYAVGVGNGTDALIIALKSLNIGEGDEVITCAMSFFATAEAIAAVGATPVFVDCTKDTFLIDTSLIEEKITKKTKAIIPIHLYGQCANMDSILELAQKYHLFVIEDAAQAAGAEYKGRKAGSMGDVGCFSFFPTKNLGCAGDGGMLVSNDLDLIKAARGYRVHGSGNDGKSLFEKNNQTSLDIDFDENLPKYFNFTIGMNSRLDEIQAAMLRRKLPYLDSWNDERRVVAKRYLQEIVNARIWMPTCFDIHKHIFYVFIILTENRKILRKYLNANGINTGIYFPVPLHLQIAFQSLGYKKGDMPNAEFVAEHSLAIPMFAELTKTEQDWIINTLNSYIEEDI